MADPRFRGCAVALVTPFDGAGVSERVLGELVEFQIDGGTAALVVCGSTGEAATMSSVEQARAIEIAVGAAAGRVPVIGGIGGSDTMAVAELSVHARRAGADALLFSPPPYNRPTQRGLLAHYRHVIGVADLPVIVYNIPSRTACNLLPETVEQLAADPRVIGVKEASGDISQIAELARRLEGRAALYSGNDDQIVPILALGGLGVVSVLANVAPAVVTRMVASYLEGAVDEARALQLGYLPLIRSLFREPNPGPIKAAVRALGFEVGDVRLPLLPIEQETMTEILERMRSAGIQLEVGV